MDNLNNLYGDIADLLSGIAGENWKSITMKIEYNEEYIELSAEVENDNNELKELDLDEISIEIADDIIKIAEILKDKTKWNKAIFELKADGFFQLNFDWIQNFKKN